MAKINSCLVNKNVQFRPQTLAFFKKQKQMKNPISIYALPGIPCNLNMFVQGIPAHTPEEVFERVAETWQISPEMIKSRSRKDDVSTARHAAAYIIRHKFNMNSTQTAQIMNRSHATVLHSCKTFENLWDTDKNVRRKIIGTL